MRLATLVFVETQINFAKLNYFLSQIFADFKSDLLLFELFRSSVMELK